MLETESKAFLLLPPAAPVYSVKLSAQAVQTTRSFCAAAMQSNSKSEEVLPIPNRDIQLRSWLVATTCAAQHSLTTILI